MKAEHFSTDDDNAVGDNDRDTTAADRSQFLDEFEKPIKLYRYLALRHRRWPMFLQKSLLYDMRRSTQLPLTAWSSSSLPLDPTNAFTLSNFMATEHSSINRTIQLKIFKIESPNNVEFKSFSKVHVYSLPHENWFRFFRSYRRSLPCEDAMLLSYVPIGNKRPRGRLPPSVTLQCSASRAIAFICKSDDQILELKGIVNDSDIIDGLSCDINVIMKTTLNGSVDSLSDSFQYKLSIQIKSTKVDIRTVKKEEITLMDSELNKTVVPVTNQPQSKILFEFRSYALKQICVSLSFNCFLCDFKFTNMSELYHHLSNYHLRFSFEMDTTEDINLIIIKLNPDFHPGLSIYCNSKDSPAVRDDASQFIFNRKELPGNLQALCSNSNTYLVHKPATGPNSQKPVTRFYSISDTAPTTYYASDSEEDPDLTDNWLHKFMTMQINDFSDVNQGEKDMMKLWNCYVEKIQLMSDNQIVNACNRFTAEYGEELRRRNLSYNYFLHLFNLYCYGLLDKFEFAQCAQQMSYLLPERL
ncbi:hypothetical protein GJ496_003654 [Pomphorhynchus laevis]|nr:hypothetical protein GJ496_003654 [Pomphorhynchus laevis]